MTDQQNPERQIPDPLQPDLRRNRRRWRRSAAAAVAGLVLMGVGGWVGMAFAGHESSAAPSAGPTTTTAAGKPGRAAGRGKAVDPARQAWAQKYGLDRATMPIQPDVASATAEQQAAAKDLLLRTQAATAQYNDLATAKAAGFDLQATLSRIEKRRPRLAKIIQRIDAGQQPPGAKMPMLHVANAANKADGKVLDPSAPETLMYGYQGQGKWVLVGVMYSANESYPQAPPIPGGPITRWHYHAKGGQNGGKLMMHLFFLPGNDLGPAYATTMGK